MKADAKGRYVCRSFYPGFSVRTEPQKRPWLAETWDELSVLTNVGVEFLDALHAFCPRISTAQLVSVAPVSGATLDPSDVTFLDIVAFKPKIFG